jgi:hypothetical protein
MMPRTLRIILVGTLLLSGSTLAAQQTLTVDGRQFPLNQFSPPGTAARWSVQSGRVPPNTFQQVRVRLPSTGVVTIHDGSLDRAQHIAAPAQFGLLVGASYRLHVSDLPEFPNQDFFPSIELIDQLHPPPGQAARFPVEIELLADELTWVSNGRLVTKVVYLEQPDRVPLTNLNGGARVTDLAPAQNAIAEADALGRPIAIVRIGGRVPDLHRPDPQFWGPLAPLQMHQSPETGATTDTNTRPHSPVPSPPSAGETARVRG